ncbi:energy transducer TonB [Dyella halodurans]|uniref:Energy transducer TonB n=1 Tax=Dyella halodurans TaxID=1920171 RepID=A0ABV9BY65_9GAMM|nr:energy transducer TonB [Dyella halodurans]
MLKLRTTASLSLLVLVVGVVGTAWLSSLTDRWPGPSVRRPSHVARTRALPPRHVRPTHEARRIVAAAKPHKPAAKPVHPTPLPALTPIDMPAPSAAWLGTADAASGRVVLHLTVDGSGRVKRASIAESSGRAALDERAVRTVLAWRFAVPAGHPDGLNGSLVMRFDDAAGPVARLP